MGVTQYDKLAFNDDLPARANCITAVRHLVKETSKLRIPNVWIGDLPHALTHKKWRALFIPKDELRTGDLLFTRHAECITHVAIAIDAERIFHCTINRGAVIDNREDFLQNYPSPFKSAQALINERDPRAYLLKEWAPLPISKA